MRITNYIKYLISSFTFYVSLLLFAFCLPTFSQEITLDYIFQDTAIINPRPSLKFISSSANKIYFYADDDYNISLNLFEFNYLTSETYKYPDSLIDASEYILFNDKDILYITGGDLYISKDFVNTKAFSKDVRLTETDEYEYSPMVKDGFAIYRRGKNFFIKRFEPNISLELQLTKDESDSISYQILSVSNFTDSKLSMVMARYDNSTRDELYFPDFTQEDVKPNKQKRGISKVKLIEHEITIKDSVLNLKSKELRYPDSTRYSTQYVDYSDDTKKILFDVDILGRHSRKLFLFDKTKNVMSELYSESDTAWYERHGNSTFFADNETIIFESEVSGYNNLHKIKSDGSGFTKIADGNFTITESAVDTKNKKIYFSANKEHPYEYFIYETDFDGITLKQLTSEKGDVEDLRISSDSSHLFYKQSFINKPAELHYLNLQDYRDKQITNTISPKFTNVDWVVPELITYSNEEDRTTIYAFVYKPKDFNPKKKYPLICFAHGAGYLQNITYGMSPYQDNFMVNTFLVSQGFIVLDIDFRGSMGYGKDFRNKTYRNLGYWEVSDYMSGINYLDKLGMVDRNKVGIYGGSYGGFITQMSVFRHPEFFKAGVTLRGVSDWKIYYKGNRWYTLARLGEYNNDNAEYYKISSPITYAEDLSVPLLITHGMLDDNVFFQQAAQLTQKLIENKKDFEIMFYPKENHAFRLQTSWLDQYKRIWKFFEKWLK